MYFQTICRINCEARDESLKFTCFPMSLKSSVLNEKSVENREFVKGLQILGPIFSKI